MLLDTLDKSGGNNLFLENQSEVKLSWSNLWTYITLSFSSDIEGEFCQYYFSTSIYKTWLSLLVLLVGFLVASLLMIHNLAVKITMVSVGSVTVIISFLMTLYIKDNIFYFRVKEYILLGCLLVFELLVILILVLDRSFGYPNNGYWEKLTIYILI